MRKLVYKLWEQYSGQEVSVEHTGGEIILNKFINDMSYYILERQSRVKEIFPSLKDSVPYINLATITTKDFKAIIPSLATEKKAIIDLRDYPRLRIFDAIGHFIAETDTVKWLLTPRLVKPKTWDYLEEGWERKPLTPDVAAKIFLLTNHRAGSYAESIAAYFENQPNVTIVGEPTAGTNGNNNRFRLPAGIVVQWTGMKVLKHDGSQLHGIGILPDIPVSPTIQGIREGRDEILEKAIELARAVE